MKKLKAAHINKKVLSEYILEHTELKEFGSLLNDMVYNKDIKSSIHISVGKKVEDIFQTYLTAQIENPIVVLGRFENEPMFTIKSRIVSNVTINIALISNFDFKHEGNDLFDFYYIYFKYEDIDYSIKISIMK